MGKAYDEMTKQERAQLIKKDSQAYIDLVPTGQGYWFQLLDGIAKAGGITEDEMRSLKNKAQ